MTTIPTPIGRHTWTGFVGRTDDGDRVFVTIRLDQHRRRYVSITGEVYAAGRALTGDIIQGGQCDDTVRGVLVTGTLASHLNEYEVDSLLAVWDRRHLGPVDSFTAERLRALGTLLESGDSGEAEDEVETLTESQAEEMYDEWLDGGWGPVEVAGMEFDPSRIIRELDPIAYSIGMREWLDNEGLEVS
jgi:hypothetical protein